MANGDYKFMLKHSKHQLSNIEFWLLIVLVCSLPLSEAVKNITSLLFPVAWLLAFIHDKEAKIILGKWDILFGFFLLSACASVLLAFEFGRNWIMLGDVFGGVILAWILSHSKLKKEQVYTLFSVIVSSTFVASIYGLWQWQVSDEKPFFELHSVGYFNQSAMYLGMVAALSIWLCLLLHKKIAQHWFIALCVVSLLFSCILLWGESRGGMIAFFITVSILVASLAYAHSCNIIKVLKWNALVVAIFSAFLWVNPHLIEKTVSRVNTPGGVSSGRGVIAEVSLEAFSHYPIFGIGVANHEKISYQTMAHWRGESPVIWKELYPKNFHPHNLYLGTLAERGIVGAFVLILLLGAWLQLILDVSKRKNLTTVERLIWGFNVSVLFVTLVAGFFNTPLRHENARLTFLGLGLMLSFFVYNRELHENFVGTTKQTQDCSNGELFSKSIGSFRS